MCALEYRFHYVAEDKRQFEVPETMGYFMEIVECDAAILQQWDLWPSFVREYQVQRHVGESSPLPPLSNFDRLDWMKPDPENPVALIFADLDWVEWGPSKPVEPSLIRSWAEKWSLVLLRMPPVGCPGSLSGLTMATWTKWFFRCD